MGVYLIGVVCLEAFRFSIWVFGEKFLHLTVGSRARRANSEALQPFSLIVSLIDP
jgi:hypothetical protein